MNEGYRYRAEGGRFCIDIRLRTSRQLFDGRDPAPFRERDLDDRAIEYLMGAAEELPRKAPMKLVFWISEEPVPGLPDATLTEAVRAHLEYEVARLDRQIQQHMRRGQVFLLFGLTVLVVFLTLAELTSAMPTGHLRQIVREGLVITGWVAMWRPIEVLLYDWWPLVEERRVYERLYEAPIEVRHEPDAASATSA
ncbi:MAG: hypothetical protein IPN17_07345 [Deltaproteobacteria bacterium]|jgi:hypothetical protein|nr:hypothetical protein [Deltaproteobacteria bacterium]MBK8692114.1 hypothetical protein [Deltaproteobacteria bacterium]MBP6830963.1 hypothetical protein [Deltaproteobacteria bacterium]